MYQHEDTLLTTMAALSFLDMLHFLVVADGHAGWSFDGFGWSEFGWVALEFLDAVDEGGAVDGFGGVREGWGCGELFVDVVDVGAGDCAGLTGGGGVHGEGEHGLEGSGFDGSAYLGGHGVASVCALGGGFGDGFEDSAQ
jgi:hypothetical protein